MASLFNCKILLDRRVMKGVKNKDGRLYRCNE